MGERSCRAHQDEPDGPIPDGIKAALDDANAGRTRRVTAQQLIDELGLEGDPSTEAPRE